MTAVSLYRRLKRALSRQRQKSRALRRRIVRVGARRAGKFADLSSNNGPISPAQFRTYAKRWDVIALKATEGTGYVNPYFPEQVRMAKAEGLLVTPYHFARPDQNPTTTGARAEARFFVTTCRRNGMRLGPRRKLWFRRTELPGTLDYETAHPSGLDQVWEYGFTGEYRDLTNHGIAGWGGERVAAATAGPLLYCGNLIRERFTGILRRLFWLAAYVASPAAYWPTVIPGRLRLAWQYTDTTDLGVGRSDGSRVYCTVRELLRLAI